MLGLSGEMRGHVAVNALWPRTTIATAAIKNLLGGDAMMNMSRMPDILAEAACRIFQKPKTFTGSFLIDDTFLAAEGVTDFDRIALIRASRCRSISSFRTHAAARGRELEPLK